MKLRKSLKRFLILMMNKSPVKDKSKSNKQNQKTEQSSQKSKEKSESKEVYDLDIPLFQLSDKDVLTIRSATSGLVAMGSTGSGKTSGSGRNLILKYLEYGFGGLVLVTKPTDRQEFEEYCRQTGRLNDLSIISPKSDDVLLNFLDYEATREGDGAGIIQNIVQLLTTIISSGNATKKGSNDDFWESAFETHLYNCIELCFLATGHISFDDINDIATSLPRNNEQLEDKEWLTSSTCFHMLKTVASSIKSGQTDQSALRNYQRLEHYFLEQYVHLAEKTRSIIDHYFNGFASKLLRDPMHRLFCTGTTITPDDCYKTGKIILVDLPAKEYLETGIFLQKMIKLVWQRAMERRNVTVYPCPVFLFADEFQIYLSDHDARFQETARSSRVCTLYLTQNMSNLYSALGGDQAAEHKVHSLLGNLATKIFHANSCNKTNTYAADLIGRDVSWRKNKGHSYGGPKDMSMSEGQSENLDYVVRPEEFARLKTGGPENDFIVEGIMHRTGNPFKATNTNHIKIKFSQL